MNAPARAHSWIWLCHQSLTVRLLTAAAGLVTAAAALAAPAEANTIDDDFVSALAKAGLNFGSPQSAVALGREVCPMLVKPGGNFVQAVERVRGGNGGMSPDMAKMFATIAIQMYCPSMITNLAEGNLAALPHIPGM